MKAHARTPSSRHLRQWLVTAALVLPAVLGALAIGGGTKSVEAGKPPKNTPTPTPGPAVSLSCPASTTLESLVGCIASHFGPFGVPSSKELSDFGSVTRRMLNGECDAIALPVSLRTIYVVRTFNDAENAQGYCVLMEVLDADGDDKVDRGWGTFIANNAAVRELSIAIAHPKADVTTESQGIGIFKATGSRTFLMAGSGRDLGTSTCQGNLGYFASDVAHNTANMFFQATQELNVWYGARNWHQLQFHGMAADTCLDVDVYMTHGVSTAPAAGDVIRTLESNLLKYHPTWKVALPGDTPSCSLTATTNVEGRLLNGVSAGSVCSIAAAGYSGKFIHIEQDPNFRKASDWAPVLLDTWPQLSMPLVSAAVHITS